jgi:hypothetical protein
VDIGLTGQANLLPSLHPIVGASTTASELQWTTALASTEQFVSIGYRLDLKLSEYVGRSQCRLANVGAEVEGRCVTRFRVEDGQWIARGVDHE